MENENEKGLILTSLDEVFKTSMISYAEEVILDRALPRVEDGLKPVQRRILYDMAEMGLTPDKPHKKCAKIVGDCLGKYHPHGDSSVYGSLVHLAQDFNMRTTLVDGHGNFGTVDGDGAAAYRYTEARLAPLALELLRDIDKDTVDFTPNFDDSLMEPTTLPGRFPNLLVNGAVGIAVGLATNIPTHNLSEVIDGTVAFIDNPKISLKEMMQYIKAPDFPTGGYIMAGNDLEEAYRTGKGKIVIRARVNIENDSGEKQNLVISELPYQVNKSALLTKISELSNEKSGVLSSVYDVVDESDRNGMRAVIKIKKEGDAKAILKYLYKKTDLETTFGINMVAIANGKPCQLGLLDIIEYYVNYQREVILRRSRFELEQAKKRAHILEGLITAVQNIDEVIEIIKGADNTTDARMKLRQRFYLSDEQANAILELKLARLTKLETYKLEEELKELLKRIEELYEIVQSKAKQMGVVKKELLEIKKKYGDDRRSKIIEGVDDLSVDDLEQELKTVDDFVVGYTEGGNFKKMTAHNFKSSDKTVKDSAVAEDFIKFCTEVKSNQYVYAFTNLGNCVKIDAETSPECRFRDKGSKFSAVSLDVIKGEIPVRFFAVDKDKMPEGELIFYTKDGMIKKSPWTEYSVGKTYFQAVKLKDDDQVINVEVDLNETNIAFVTEGGMVLKASKDDIPSQGRISGGVKGIKLGASDKIVFVGQVEKEGEFFVVTEKGLYKKVSVDKVEVTARNCKGVKIITLSSDKVVYSTYLKEDFEAAVIDSFGVAFSVKTSEIESEERATKGKNLKNVNKKRMPQKVFRIL